MTHSRLTRSLALCTSLLGIACTETVTREVVVEGADAGTSTEAAGDGTVLGDEPTGALGPFGARPQTDGTLPSSVTGAAPPLTDPDTVVGMPGQSVDCALELPCRWLSADSGFAVTLASGDDTGPRGGLSVAFLVDANHDTEVSYGGGAEALGAGGERYRPIARELGRGNGIAPSGVLAGETLVGRIHYEQAADEPSLKSWRIGLLDNGLAREATFENVPLGPAVAFDADCAFVLPCSWLSADGSAEVTLGSVGGLNDARRLSVGFAVTTPGNDSLALAGASAVGLDGTRFQSRTQSLGTENGFETVVNETIGGLALAGTVDFLRTSGNPRGLSRLQLELYRDAPVPRWHVVFENVPLP